jgi:hypothetical protein
VWSYKHTSRVSLSWLTAVGNSGSIVSSPATATICRAAI